MSSATSGNLTDCKVAPIGEWRPIESAPRPKLEWDYFRNDKVKPVLIWDGFNKVRWLAAWDDDCGYFRGLECIDEPNRDPDRLYGASLWMDVPPGPATESTEINQEKK